MDATNKTMMKRIEETIRNAATIEELISVLDRLYEMIEIIKTDGESLQLLGRCLTDIHLAMKEMLYRDHHDGVRNARTSQSPGRHSSYLDIQTRIEALHAAIGSSLRRAIGPQDAQRS